jgi:isoleucyl-tRNA synthetase
VTLDAGTGAVHTAGGHGPDDYTISQKYGLEIANPVGPDGTCRAPIRAGRQRLQSQRHHRRCCVTAARCCTLKMQHSYPCCWRHKSPIIFRATRSGSSAWIRKACARAESLKEIKGVQWIPDWEARIESMVANRPDWCISRQRTWGVPMSLFVHKETEELHPRTLN